VDAVGDDRVYERERHWHETATLECGVTERDDPAVWFRSIMRDGPLSYLL
jgi:hypothetical protein